MDTSPEPADFSEDGDSEAGNKTLQSDPDSRIYKDVENWLERLRRSDRSLYNLMALEVWSIARTMDEILPGFWSRFMENRQVALKQFVKHRKDRPVEDFLASQGSSEQPSQADDEHC